MLASLNQLSLFGFSKLVSVEASIDKLPPDNN